MKEARGRILRAAVDNEKHGPRLSPWSVHGQDSCGILVLQPDIGYQSFLVGPGALTDGSFLVKVTEIPRRWRSSE